MLLTSQDAAAAAAAALMLGVAAIKVSIESQQRSWTQGADKVALVDPHGVIFLSSDPEWKFRALRPLSNNVRAELEQAAREETDHLAWCETRINELGGRKSLLNPLWFGGAFGMGVVAGLLGDKWNLGFLAETERQVEAHLDGHLQKLPEADAKSRAVVEQMKVDEAQHAQTAVDHGGAPLPLPVKQAMRFAANVMRQTASRV